MLKKSFILFLIFIMTTMGAFAAGKKSKAPFKTKQIEVETKDHFMIRATLAYPKSKKNKNSKSKKKVHYPTVVLLHSLGYSSGQWGNLPIMLIKQGYAVLSVDLRGHGVSNKDAKFKIHSWPYFKYKMFEHYPDDVTAIIAATQKATKKADFNHYAIVGGDIGANTAVLVARKMPVKPKALILLSPSRTTKGLYIPVAMTELGNTPILTMSSKADKITCNEEIILKRFSQAEYVINNVNTNMTGMMLTRANPNVNKTIIGFINGHMRYHKPVRHIKKVGPKIVGPKKVGTKRH